MQWHVLDSSVSLKFKEVDFQGPTKEEYLTLRNITCGMEDKDKF